MHDIVKLMSLWMGPLVKLSMYMYSEWVSLLQILLH